MEKDTTPLDSFPPKKVKGNIKMTTLVNTILLVFTGFFILSGTLFKIMHWPFSGILLVSGLTIGAIWLLKELFIK